MRGQVGKLEFQAEQHERGVSPVLPERGEAKSRRAWQERSHRGKFEGLPLVVVD